MGLRYNFLDSQLFVTALKSNMSQCRTVNGQIKHGTNYLISSLGDGTGLSGAAYTAGEGLFTEVMYPTTNQFEAALDDVQSDLNRYLSAENSVYQYGDLNEDDLKEQINQKQEQIADLENQKQYYENMAYGNPAFYSSMIAAAKNIQNVINETERQLNDLQKQLSALEDFEYQTSPLFQDSLTAFSDIVRGITAINNITVDSSGNYYTNGADMSWLTMLENQGFDSESGEDKALEKAVSKLGLDDEARAYWEKEMKSELKNIPKSQWNAKIKEAAANLQFDADGNILQIGPFQQGIIVLKNGVYDETLTEQANKEIDSERWEAVRDSFTQLLVGGLTMLGGGLLDLAGVAVITGGAGFTLTGAGAVVGTPAIAGGVALEGVGTGALITGGATVGNVLSRINLSTEGMQYSFTVSAEERAKAVSDTEQKIAGLTKGLDNITESGARFPNYEQSGGMDQLNKDFDELNLSNIKEIETKKYGVGRAGKLPDGSSVTARAGSKSGPTDDGFPTLEIKRPNGMKVKIRYPEEIEK
ncbi:MAG: hypothetical protein LBI13_03275 [Streptococcaceae bacterium]|jgi:hypothetical protein|nr:hypothetical protein [Streptococcaceae bacterium]